MAPDRRHLERRAAIAAVGLLLTLGGSCAPAACGPESCSGCCQGTHCVGGTEAAQCGSSGAGCAVCGPDERCGAGTCQPDAGGAVDGGPADGGFVVLDGGASLRLYPPVASLRPGESLSLSASVTGPLSGSSITWTAEGSATVSSVGVVRQAETGVVGESVITACVGSGASTLCDSASILPGYTASELGRFCDGLNPCPTPFACTTFASNPSGSGFCSSACLTDRGCAFGYQGVGDPFCPSGASWRTCALSCATSSLCPASLSCVDTNADGISDTCVDFGQAGWPPMGEGATCQNADQCTFPSLGCAAGTCQTVACPGGASPGQRCDLSSPGDGVCTPMLDKGVLCVLSGSSTGDCSTVATRPESASRCVAGQLCVEADGALGACERACQGGIDCALATEDCIAPIARLPALQTCQARGGPNVTCLGTASLSLPFVYQETTGSWGQRIRGGELVDLNGDGRAELILPVQGSGGLVIATAMPQGRALELVERAAGPAFEQVRAGDVSGDGVKDVVGFDSSQAYVMGRQPDGGLGLVATVALVEGIELAVVADVNADALADLVVASASSNQLVVRTAQPAGGFGPATALPLADGGAGHLLVEDCDGDGVKDVISIGPSVVSVWKGSQAGLGPRVDQPHQLGGAPAAQLLADFNGDHRTDVGYRASSGPGFELRVLEAQGGCAFAVTTTPLSADAQADGRPLAVLDTSGDGLADLLVAGRDLGVDRFLGTAGGFTSTSEDFLPDVQEGSSVAPLIRPSGLASFGTAVLDGVSGPQLVRVVGSTIEVIGLTTSARLPRPLGSAFRAGPVVGQAELNGDDLPDVVGTFGVTLSQPDGGWVDSTGLFGGATLPDGGPGAAIRGLADLDGDGVGDLVAEVACGTAGQHVALALGSGLGAFSVSASSASSTCSGPGAFRAVLDWDGVNGPDVLCEGPDGVVPFLNDGAGGFTADQPIGLFALLPGLVGDFDGDHRDDVVFQVTGSTPVLAVVFATRSSLIQVPPGYSLKAAAIDGCGATPALLAVDLDQDGSQELVGVLTGPAGDLLFIWRAATEGLELRRLSSRSGPLASLAAGDLDGDGSLDLVVGTAPPDGLGWSAPSVHVYFGDGKGHLGPPRGMSIDTFDRSAALVDVDRDGQVDLLLPRDPGSQTALSWPNRCP